ncbi:MAG: disulfide bond formation protein B [Pseudomonadota bacterium]
MTFDKVGKPQIWGAAFMAVAMAIVVGTALGFEHIGGFVPCKLCLEQRQPYYLGVPIALLALIGGLLRWPTIIVRGGLIMVGLLMAYGVALSIYHSGVEWSWWMGPADCSTSSTTGITTDATNLLGALDDITPPSCDEAAGRFLGLSFAGWNVIASLFLTVASFKAAFARGSG